MSSPRTTLQKQPLPYEVFEHLKSVITDLGRSTVPDGVVLTNADLFPNGTNAPFVVVLTSELRVLWHCSTSPNDAIHEWGKGQTCYPQLVFDSKIITAFLKHLRSQVTGQANLLTQLKSALELLATPPSHRAVTHETLIQNLLNVLSQTVHTLNSHHQTQLEQQSRSQHPPTAKSVVPKKQELQPAQGAMQSANRVKSDFLATMSHELRTPLTCVIGMSATLIRWSLGPLNDKQRSYLQTIHDSGEHLLELINDMLELSHVESGRAVLNLNEFSLSALVQQSVQMLREKATTGGVNFKTNLNIPPERDRFVADARRVRQILYNLLSNAIKFTPAGGHVTLQVWLEPNAVIFQVEDTGIGIPLSQQPLLFQKFQQLDTSYRRTYEGTGLGLALTKQFVDLHRGWIEVSSTEGQGTVFTVELPNQNGLNTPGAVLPAYPTGAHSRIVLIEDNEESATLICEMLTAAGYHVIWIVEDSTATEQIQFLQPSAVIISLSQLNGAGLQLVQQFRQLLDVHNIKIIVLTPPTATKDPQPYLSAGADTVLTKPLKPEQLVHKIDILLSPEMGMGQPR